MSFVGTVENGVVVLPPGTNLADGTEVRVEPVRRKLPAKRSPAKRPQSLSELLRPFIGIAEGLPSDFAENHDHYAHGAPKRRKG